MKKIIVPVDFSEYSDYALETAAIFAKKFNIEIIVLHMLEMPSALLTTSASQVQFENLYFLNLAKNMMEEFLEKKYLKGVKVIPTIKQVKAFNEINDIAKDTNTDLIIMGSHGTSGLKEVFIGSNAEKVVRHSEIPVLIIKHSPILTNIENVVFACDFLDSSIPAYLNAKQLLTTLNVKIHLVYINLPGEHFYSTKEMEEKVIRFLKKAGGNDDNEKQVNYVCDYNTEDGILNFSNTIKADMIAMATHGRKGISHFFSGSTTEDVTNHSLLPVMTFKI